MRRTILVAIIAFGLLGCSNLTRSISTATPTSPPASASASPSDPLGRPQVTIRKHDGTSVTLSVEIADTPESQAKGLSNRTALEPTYGMLFVFPSPQPIEFWMHDTNVPLSIAFVGDDRRIIDLQDMQPLTDDHHIPPGPIRYAIEANQGFFAKAGVVVGDVVDLSALPASFAVTPTPSR